MAQDTLAGMLSPRHPEHLGMHTPFKDWHMLTDYFCSPEDIENDSNGTQDHQVRHAAKLVVSAGVSWWYCTVSIANPYDFLPIGSIYCKKYLQVSVQFSF